MMMARTRERGSPEIYSEEEEEFVENEEDEDEQEEDSEADLGEGKEAIRKKYRGLIDVTLNNRQELVSGDADQILTLIEKGDELFTGVKETREATLDSQLLGLTSTIGAEKIHQLSTGLRNYSVSEYIAQVKRLLTEGVDSLDDGWEPFYHEYVTPHFFRAPRATFLYGSLDKEEPIRKERKQKEKEKVDEKVVPKELRMKKKDIDEESLITRQVKHVHQTLGQISQEADERPVYWEFLHDPDSFARTVENHFHFSFLMKDGHAKTTIDEDTGLPVIEPAEQPEGKDVIDQQCQTVVRIDWALWEKLNRNGVRRQIEPLEDLQSGDESEDQPQSQSHSKTARSRGSRGGGEQSSQRKRARQEAYDGEGRASKRKKK